jgi:hypothetical protein
MGQFKNNTHKKSKEGRKEGRERGGGGGMEGGGIRRKTNQEIHSSQSKGA